MAKSAKQSGKTGGVDSDVVRALAKLLDETNLTEIEYGRDGWHVRVAKRAPAAPATVHHVSSAAPAAPVSPPPASADDGSQAKGPGVVRSPMVGVVYTAPDPDKPPFIKVGDKVERGQTVLLIEAMKVFNPILAPISGVVSRIIINNGAPVEFDELLLIIE